MTVPLLSDLREPPVVGRFYMVPAVRFNWCGLWADWPVLGPLHEDERFFAFKEVHYHVDVRFVSKDLHRRALLRDDKFSQSQAYPLARRRGDDAQVPRHRPTLRRRKCSSSDFPYQYEDMRGVVELRRHYGDRGSQRPDAIRLADGRLLCPHRKVDLSQFPADEHGIVTCPLHGLRVRCSPASVSA